MVAAAPAAEGMEAPADSARRRATSAVAAALVAAADEEVGAQAVVARVAADARDRRA